MKTAQEYALEEWTNGDGGYSPYDIAKMSFDAGLAEAKSIWRKPEERPERNEQIIVIYANGRPCTIWDTGDDYSPEDEAADSEAWCYLSDFLKLLPDRTTEVGE